jgi:AcrR family transcriptional regulator
MENEKLDKKENILNVAEKLFAELGFDGASTRAISKAASVNMAMLNYYFGSKEGLFVAVFERRVSSYRMLLKNINNEQISSWEKLQKCIDFYIDSIVSNTCFYKLIHRELELSQRSALTKKVIDILLANVLEVKKIIEDGMNNGSFYKNADVEMTIASIFGTKYYILNSPHLSSSFLGKDVQDKQFINEELKPRMKSHLKNLLKAYLIFNHDKKD